MPETAFRIPASTTAIVNREEDRLAVGREELPVASLAANETLVEVQAFSVNRGELALLAARPPGWRPGQDLAGIVIAAAADGSGPSVGDRVVALVEGGGWATHVAVPTGRLAVVPDSVAITDAATLGLAGLTALRILRVHGPLLGVPVLITGASSSVGRFAVQLAAIQGARVTAVANGHLEELRALGAEAVVASPAQAEQRFELILENVGGATLTDSITVAAPEATVVIYGTTSGEPTPLTIYDFLGHENVRLQTYFSYAQPGEPSRDLALLVDLLASDRLAAPIGRVSSWDQLHDGLAALERREISGKLVLTIP